MRVPPSGTWERRRADLYGLAADWIEPVDIAREDAIEHLVRRYLGGFGPATSQGRRLLHRPFRGRPRARAPRAPPLPLKDDDELLDLPRAPPRPRHARAVRFLGTWDASLLVHARRTGVLPEEHRPRIFHTKAPQSFPTFLVDGAVAAPGATSRTRSTSRRSSASTRDPPRAGRRGRPPRGVPRLSRYSAGFTSPERSARIAISARRSKNGISLSPKGAREVLELRGDRLLVGAERLRDLVVGRGGEPVAVAQQGPAQLAGGLLLLLGEARRRAQLAGHQRHLDADVARVAERDRGLPQRTRSPSWSRRCPSRRISLTNVPF